MNCSSAIMPRAGVDKRAGIGRASKNPWIMGA